MTQTTPQFKWQDRDAAAHGMLHLVHYAPPFISLLATELLRAFRSSEILPDLYMLVSDSEQTAWKRVYALRAYTAVEGDRLVEAFAPFAREALLHRERLTHNDDSSRARTFAMMRPDLLDELADFVDKHPCNRQWFFECVANADATIQHDFLRQQFMYEHSESFLALVRSQLGQVADEGDEAEEATPDPIEASPKQSDETYRTSTPYVYLSSLFEDALNGDSKAHQQLVTIANRLGGNIPMRAVATHFIGHLSLHYEVYTLLAHLLRYGDVDWASGFHAPIRHEAGEALMRMPTALIWETMVDSYFIHPRDGLTTFQIDWIAHVTDVLSGDRQPYKGIRYGDEAHRPWFRALSKVTDQEFASMV